MPLDMFDHTDSAARARRVHGQMATVARRVGNADFEPVRPGRWRHKASAHEVETGYTYGEGRVRVYSGSGREPMTGFVISGRVDDLFEFNDMFPAASR